MAFLTSNRISALGVQLLLRQMVLPMTVSRVAETEFTGDGGDTVKVRIRQPGSARTQASAGAAITYDTLSETSVNVTLSHLYHATKVTDQDLTLNLVDFGAQVLDIQTSAVGIGSEDVLGTVLDDLAADDSFAQTDPGSDAAQSETKAQVLQAREALTAANVPPGERYIAATPSVITRMLHVDQFVKANESGADTALRAAVVGRLFGFQVLETNALADGSMVAYHRSAFAYATKVPVIPAGAADAAIASYDGVGLRHVRQYDPDTLSDASVVSTFAGAALVDANRTFKVDGGS